MKINKDLNKLTESEFISIFGSIFEKSSWIAVQAFKQKPFKNSKDLIDKMIKIFESCSIEEMIKIFNLHPKLAIEKKLTSLSSKEQSGAKLDNCTDEEILEFEKLNLDYQKKFMFPFIVAVKGKKKDEILKNFRFRIKNNYQKEFQEAKKQVMNIALLRLNELFKNEII
tara:strand:+ start:331 stop:837 length:507 start_codon:yes stop_codon:yes gene_type:complete